ncbi:hypothetical protein BF14_030475 [Streptomyces griseus]|nr:hypothetical protein BF14_030475 [Streptomyces griseus]
MVRQPRGPPGLHLPPEARHPTIAEAGLTASKTGITFPPHKPVPDQLVTRLANASSKHVDE